MEVNYFEGKSAKVLFDSGLQFQLDFMPNNQMRWTSIRKEDAGHTDVETIHLAKHADHIYTIDWVEADGLCVSYTVDTDKQYVKSFMTFTDESYRGGRRPFTHEGPFEFI
ncbi:MAG TPA: MoaF N-terminal domain-containing protein [Candidatus Dorea intestinavium]|nr:MoaF N-terminal domain-containing protein [Candidatus Dorea intestinavium]